MRPSARWLGPVLLVPVWLAASCGGGAAHAPAASVEVCGNGVDDDGDGAVDCADSACRDEDACTRCGDGAATGRESCDGRDLRGVTCAELGFNSGVLACLPACVLDLRGCATIELCDNGVDDDGDGDKDCDDLDCADSAACARCGDGRVSGGEQCDDGNLVSGDCCAGCRAEPGCEIEPDDERDTAVALVLDGAGHAERRGVIAPAGDHDVYALTVPAGSTATIVAATSAFVAGASCSPGVDTFVELLDAAGRRLAADDDSGEGTCSRLRLAGLPPGPVYVRVSASPFAPGASFAYRLELTVVLAPCGDGKLDEGQQCDDGNRADGDGCSAGCQLEPRVEVEPNDTVATANGPYVPSFIVTATVGAPQADNYDSDWFAVDLPRPAHLRVETFADSAPSCAELIAEPSLHAADGAPLPTARSPGQDPRSCGVIDTRLDAAPPLAPGSYRVRVRGRQRGTVPQSVPYRVVVSSST